MIGATLAALPMGVGVAAATSSGGGGDNPKCDKYHKCPPDITKTVTVTTPGGTETKTVTTPAVTVTAPPTTVTVTAPSAPSQTQSQSQTQTVVVSAGPTNGTVNITITTNGVPQTITVPGTVPGTKPSCVSTASGASAKLGPLPKRFDKVKRVAVVIGGRHEVRTLTGKHLRSAKINVAGLPCGVYPIVTNDFPNTRAVVPVLRIWTLGAGKKITRAGFPDPLPPIGLS